MLSLENSSVVSNMFRFHAIKSCQDVIGLIYWSFKSPNQFLGISTNFCSQHNSLGDFLWLIGACFDNERAS